jgi:hypothetical protein
LIYPVHCTVSPRSWEESLVRSVLGERAVAFKERLRDGLVEFLWQEDDGEPTAMLFDLEAMSPVPCPAPPPPKPPVLKAPPRPKAPKIQPFLFEITAVDRLVAVGRGS